jgi:hypothetical protein
MEHHNAQGKSREAFRRGSVTTISEFVATGALCLGGHIQQQNSDAKRGARKAASRAARERRGTLPGSI